MAGQLAVFAVCDICKYVLSVLQTGWQLAQCNAANSHSTTVVQGTLGALVGHVLQKLQLAKPKFCHTKT